MVLHVLREHASQPMIGPPTDRSRWATLLGTVRLYKLSSHVCSVAGVLLYRSWLEQNSWSKLARLWTGRHWPQCHGWTACSLLVTGSPGKDNSPAIRHLLGEPQREDSSSQQRRP